MASVAPQRRADGLRGRQHRIAAADLAVLSRVLLPIRPLAERAANITRWTEFDRGGHFAALEQPELLTTDVRAFFSGLAG